MSRESILLEEWANKVDRDLPRICPKCAKELDHIRYGYDRTIEHIRFTGVTNQYDHFVAECPYCGNRLLYTRVGGPV